MPDDRKLDTKEIKNRIYTDIAHRVALKDTKELNVEEFINQISPITSVRKTDEFKRSSDPYRKNL